MGMKFTFSEAGTELSDNYNMGNVSTTLFSPSFSFGMNATDTIGITAGFAVPFAKEDIQYNSTDMEMSLAVPTLSAGVTVKVINKKVATGKLDFGYVGSWAVITGDFEDSDGKLTSVIPNNTLYAQFRYNYDFSKKFTYGFKAYVPFSFIGKSDTEIEFGGTKISEKGDLTTVFNPSLSNGVMYSVKPTFDLKAGIYTELPNVKCDDVGGDDNYTVSNMTNSYYIGFTVKPSKNVLIDAVANVGHENSLDDVWKTTIHASVTAKF